jgi:hypothetical protein
MPEHWHWPSLPLTKLHPTQQSLDSLPGTASELAVRQVQIPFWHSRSTSHSEEEPQVPPISTGAHSPNWQLPEMQSESPPQLAYAAPAPQWPWLQVSLQQSESCAHPPSVTPQQNVACPWTASGQR